MSVEESCSQSGPPAKLCGSQPPTTSRSAENTKVSTRALHLSSPSHGYDTTRQFGNKMYAMYVSNHNRLLVVCKNYEIHTCLCGTIAIKKSYFTHHHKKIISKCVSRALLYICSSTRRCHGNALSTASLTSSVYCDVLSRYCPLIFWVQSSAVSRQVGLKNRHGHWLCRISTGGKKCLPGMY